MWEQAVGYCERAIRIADEIGHGQARDEARVSLAAMQLHADDPNASLNTVRAADAGYPRSAPMLALIGGVAHLLIGERENAKHTLSDACRWAEQLEQTGENYQALDTKALALCGLALIAQGDELDAARGAFQAARAITCERGIVWRVLRMFDTLAAADQDGVLSPIRSVAAGEA